VIDLWIIAFARQPFHDFLKYLKTCTQADKQIVVGKRLFAQFIFYSPQSILRGTVHFTTSFTSRPINDQAGGRGRIPHRHCPPAQLLTMSDQSPSLIINRVRGRTNE